MINFTRLLLVCLVTKGIHSLIVPEEVPSLLSLVYSNIPPIKKGTDSRLGWGFRLGDHADIQVMVELGPQTNTRPLGNEKDKNGGDSKREVANNLRNTLWAQNQLIKQQKISNTEGGKWLQSWSSAMGTRPKVEQQQPSSLFSVFQSPNEGIGEIDAELVIPDVPDELEELYGRPITQRMRVRQPHTTGKPQSTSSKLQPQDVDVIQNEEVTTIKITTTTDPKDALDNVDMDE